MGGGVFICHASEDAEQASDVVRVLEDAGVRCWIAPRDIQAGDNYAQAILEALGAAPALVLLFSAAADASPHVMRELETAVGSATRIVPVRLEPVEPSQAMRYFIGTAQWLDIAGRGRADWTAELVAAVRRAVAAPVRTRYDVGEVPAGREVPARDRRTLGRRYVPLAAAGVVAAVGLAVAVAMAMGDSDQKTDEDSRPEQSGSSASGSPSSDGASTPAESASSSAATNESVIVANESFQRGPGPFGVGDLSVNTGVMTRQVRNGAYRVGVRGIGPGWDSWNYVDVAPIAERWSVTTTVALARGFCGVMAGDGVTTYTAVVNGAGTVVEISRHVGGRTPEERRFPVEPAATGAVTLARDGETLVLSAGQRRVAVVDAVDLGPLTQAGLDIVGDTATCEFDSFSASHQR